MQLKQKLCLHLDTCRISMRPISPGLGIKIFRSNLPGLTSAGSRMSGLFVEAIVITFPLPSKPSKLTRSCSTTTMKIFFLIQIKNSKEIILHSEK